jgi:hypothetical protein
MTNSAIKEMAAAVAAGMKSVIQLRDAIDVEAIAEAALAEFWRDKIAPIWTVGDVRTILGDEQIFVTDDAGIEILQAAQHGHSPERGISWDVLREHVPEDMTIEKGYVSPKLIAERMAELRILKSVEAETRTTDLLGAMFLDDDRPEDLVFDSIPTQEDLQAIVRSAMVYASHEEWVAAAEGVKP